MANGGSLTLPILKVSVMNFDGTGKWLRLAVGDAGGYAAVKSVAVQGGGSSSWQQLTNTWGATWETGKAPSPPLSFQVS
jgi:hypothetical protein